MAMTEHDDDPPIALWRDTCGWCDFGVSARTHEALIEALLEHERAAHPDTRRWPDGGGAIKCS